MVSLCVSVSRVQENRAGSLLRTTRQDLISQYLRMMGPKLQSITNGAVGTLFDFSRPSPVKRKTAGRLGTDTPTDWFSLMSEHLHLVKAAGSLTLQRKLLSLIMGEIASYGGQVLYQIMDLWRRTPEGTSSSSSGHAGTVQPLPRASLLCITAWFDFFAYLCSRGAGFSDGNRE